MKLNLAIILPLCIFVSSFAQDKSVEFSHYVFAEFTPGHVLMKNGVKNVASLNYNSLSEEMIFESNGEKLAIVDEQLQEIDTVFVAARKFIRRENKFLELIYRANAEVYVEYKCRIKYPERVNGPGGRTSQTSSSETYTPTDFRRIIYEIVLPTGYATTPYSYYWIEKGGAFTKFKNLNQLMKLYPNKKKILKAYIKKHRINYNNQEDMVKLIQHIENI